MNEFDELDEYWTRRVDIGRLPLPIEGEQDVILIALDIDMGYTSGEFRESAEAQ